MRLRPGPAAIALLLIQVAIFWGTAYLPGLGIPAWHHLASLGLTLAATAALWPAFARSRRFLALGVLASSALAAVSGFWLLYWKEGIRAAGFQDWGVFWHVLWSWFAAVFFLMHTWINRRAFLHFFQRSFTALRAGLVHGGAYVLLVLAFAITWSEAGRTWFDDTNYIQLGLYAWLIIVVPTYAGWLWSRTARVTALRHWPVRRAVDLMLVPVSVLVIVSGVVLTFFDPWTDAAGLKYVSKYWHVWPSVAFSVLAFTHGAQAWNTVQAHWRSYERYATTPDVDSPAPNVRTDG